MAANDPVGIVDKYIIKTTDNLGESTETTVSNKFRTNPDATYTQVDTASRALANLSRNTYNDTILVTNISVNEKVSG